MRILLCGVLLALGAILPSAGLAQPSPATTGAPRDRFGLNVSLLRYGTGDDTNCGEGVGFGAGAEVRTRGAWLLALGADLVLAGPQGCTQVLPLTTYRGELVEEWAGVSYPFAPRVGVLAGRAFRVRRFLLEPALGVAVARGKNDFFPADRSLWKPWVGGSVTVGTRGAPLRLRLEYGRHAVHVRYQRHERIIHEFDRWEDAFRVAAVF